MSSNAKKGGGSMPIRIDDEVYKWLSALKDANGESSISATLRTLVLERYPNIAKIVTEAESKELERVEILKSLKRDL